MRIGAISDIHLYPGVEMPHNLKYLDKLVVVGDCFNVIPLGPGAWNSPEGRWTVTSVIVNVPPDTTFILGNHEGRLSWLRDLLKPFKYPVVRSLDMTIEGKDYRFIHGHQFSEWRWLSKVAPGLTEWLTSNPITRKWWYQFCTERGWIASGLPESNEKYDLLVSMVWGWAAMEAERANKTYVVGHTHTPAKWDNLIDLGSNEVTEIG